MPISLPSSMILPVQAVYILIDNKAHLSLHMIPKICIFGGTHVAPTADATVCDCEKVKRTKVIDITHNATLSREHSTCFQRTWKHGNWLNNTLSLEKKKKQKT